MRINCENNKFWYQVRNESAKYEWQIFKLTLVLGVGYRITIIYLITLSKIQNRFERFLLN